MDELAGDILLYPLKCSAFPLISVGKVPLSDVLSMCRSVIFSAWMGKDKALLYDECF